MSCDLHGVLVAPDRFNCGNPWRGQTIVGTQGRFRVLVGSGGREHLAPHWA
jgi:hypothetical protein